MIHLKKVLEQVSSVIQNTLVRNKTSYFPNTEKLIQAFEYYVYFRYAGKINIGNATQTFLQQINSNIHDFTQLSKQQVKEIILVLFSIIQSFENIEQIHEEDMNSVQLRFQQLAILQSNEFMRNQRRKQKNKFYSQEQSNESINEDYYIHQEGLMRLMFQKGIQKEIKNKSSLITPQMTFNFIELQEDKNSLVLENNKPAFH